MVTMAIIWPGMKSSLTPLNQNKPANTLHSQTHRHTLVCVSSVLYSGKVAAGNRGKVCFWQLHCACLKMCVDGCVFVCLWSACDFHKAQSTEKTDGGGPVLTHRCSVRECTVILILLSTDEQSPKPTNFFYISFLDNLIETRSGDWYKRLRPLEHVGYHKTKNITKTTQDCWETGNQTYLMRMGQKKMHKFQDGIFHHFENFTSSLCIYSYLLTLSHTFLFFFKLGWWYN